MTTKNKIVFTGGGSSGHVTPNLALISKFFRENWEINYIGSKNGIERDLLAKTNVPYHGIACGKLRRYLSWENFTDLFKILLGIIQAFFICRKLKPNLIFSTGGFVAFPVVIAGWLNRIPIIIHGCDLTPGLANKLSYPFAKKICLSFAETAKYFKNKEKLLITGTPIRAELLAGDAQRGLQLCKFSNDKKIILVIGGGLGAESLNNIIRLLLPKLLPNFHVIHLCGKNKVDASFKNISGYIQFEYLHNELADVLACVDLVISRAGANSIYELIALRKPHILIPLSAQASRGDQIVNAQYFAKLGLSTVIFEEELSEPSLLEKILWVETHSKEINEALNKYEIIDSVQIIYDLAAKLNNLHSE